MLKNPWSKKAIEEVKEIQAARKTRAAIEAAMTKKAKELLADPRFGAYRKLYQDYRDVAMEDLMMLAEQDPIKYAFKVRQLIDTLKAYRLLISSLEDDASRPVEEEKS